MEPVAQRRCAMACPPLATRKHRVTPTQLWASIPKDKMPPPSRFSFKGRDRSESAFGRKANVCDEVLTEARRLTRAGQFEAPLNQLIARACELLDEMDEILLTLRPSKDAPEFGAAAALHRELEFLQDEFSAGRLQRERMLDVHQGRARRSRPS